VSTPDPTPPPTVDRHAAARLLGCSYSTIRRLEAAGTLRRVVGPGQAVRLYVEDLAAIQKKHTQGDAA